MSLMSRIEQFYVSNPYEWMTYDDLAIKFGATRRQMVKAMENLRDAGRLNLEAVYVVRVKDQG